MIKCQVAKCRLWAATLSALEAVATMQSCVFVMLCAYVTYLHMEGSAVSRHKA